MRAFPGKHRSEHWGEPATGVTKRITWDMAADWSVDFAQVQVEIMTKDNRNVLGVESITVPGQRRTACSANQPTPGIKC